ncbi:MAG TPA: UvrB/UvrC motif-containing protein [Syntrophomonadaceae bacterium]|jgi:protein arginine kinase activator|nr:hypothetical protein [Syntrophomonadaceae bacterium]HOQ08590.1 UvrB/UvrC motif-containing protein [Syntrophomonadaceae bacterium]HPU49441.1 UvrB/UvrC motif-containing protein [Syntrophomonadaceae bacterium]
MFCDECKQKPATVHFTQFFNGTKMETHLCDTCAAKKGALFMNGQFSIPNLLGSFLGHTFGILQQTAASPNNLTCSHCGVTFNDITHTGKLGCAECYREFDQALEPTLRRIHGNSQHVGKVPSRGGEKVLIKKKIERLKAQLQEAVTAERYEQAAEIRDSIKELEKQLE